MLRRTFDVLEPMFVDQVLPVSGHGLLATAERWEALLDQLPPTASEVRKRVSATWAKSRSSPSEKWEELKKHLSVFLKSTAKNGGNKSSKGMSTKERNRLENWHVETVFRYTYPRLDINVSTHRNHLLKSPFCVHPGTGRVCVPISADKVDDFDPFAVPTLSQLVKELDESSTDETVSSDWQRTSLKAYFTEFQKEFLVPMEKSTRRQEKEAAEEKAAIVGDF